MISYMYGDEYTTELLKSYDIQIFYSGFSFEMVKSLRLLLKSLFNLFVNM